MKDLHQQESVKRARHLPPEERWRLILDAIAWGEAQATVRRNTPARCLDEEARRLGRRRPPDAAQA